MDSQHLISERISFDSLSEEYAKEDEIYRTKIQKVSLSPKKSGQTSSALTSVDTGSCLYLLQMNWYLQGI